jgi:hypothetical protein
MLIPHYPQPEEAKFEIGAMVFLPLENTQEWKSEFNLIQVLKN